MRKTARLSFALIGLAIITVLLGIVPFNAGFMRGPIETAVYDATGLPLSIRDRIVLRLGLNPSVSSGGIVLGDQVASPLLMADSLYAKVGLIALLRGRIHVHDLNANGVVVDYCSTLPNFGSDSSDDTGTPSLAVDAIEIKEITIGCGPPTQPDPLRIDIAEVTASAPKGAPIQLNANASVSAIDFSLTATGGELKQLLAKPEEFPVQISLESASVTADLSGQLRAPMTEPTIDARLTVLVPDVQPVSESFGSSLPAVGSLHAKGRIRGNAEVLELIEVIGELGETRFSFDTTLRMGGERPHVGLTATLQQLDLAPFMDDGPNANQADPVEVQGDIDLGSSIEMLGMFDADLSISALRILGAPVDLGAVEITAAVMSGKLELHSFEAKVFRGEVAVSGSFDSQTECPDLKLRALGHELDLDTPNNVLPQTGRIGAYVNALNLDVSSCGRTLFTHRDSLIAKVGISGGRMSLDDDPFPFVAKQLDLAIKPGGHSRINLIGQLAEEELDATITTGSLQTLLQPGPWPVEIVAHGLGSRFELRGQAGLLSGQPVLDALVELEAPHVGALISWGAGSPDADLPLSTTARLRLDESRLIADAIALSLGASDLNGGIVWNHAADPDTLAATLHSSYLDLDEINSLFPAATVQADHDTDAVSDSTGSLIPAGITLPPVDLDLKIDALHGRGLDLQDLNVSGRLRAGFIDDARVSVRVEDEVLLSGTLDLDLRDSPVKASLDVVAENVDIGLLMARLEVADDLQLRADGIDLLVTTEGETPAQFLENTLLEARLQGFYWRLQEDNPALGGDTEGPLGLSLRELRVTTAPGRPATWTANGQLDDTSLELWMETPSLIDTFGASLELPFTLVAAADNNVVMLEARVDLSAEESVAANIRFSGELLESENRSLAQLEAPLAGYEISSNLLLTENKLDLADLRMQIGTSTADGRFTVTGDGERRRFDIMLHVPFLQTDDLSYWSRDVSEESIDDDEYTNSEATENKGVLLVARDVIAKMRESNDFDIKLRVDELRMGTDLLGRGEIRLFVDEDDFNLKPLTFHAPGGSLDAEYMASSREGRLDASLKVHADALTYGGLLRLVDQESEARGILYLDTDISANTEWSKDAVALELLLRHGDGSVSFAAWPENIESGVLDLWSANLVFALLPQPEGGKASRLNCIATRFDIDNGVMKARAPLLDSTDSIVRGRGTIDFAKEELDLLVWPQAKREKFLSVSTPVKVTGTFDDYQIGVEPAGFIGTMIKLYTSLIYVPFKWLTGERFPPDGTATCFDTMDWELTPELHDYFLQRDFSAPPIFE